MEKEKRPIIELIEKSFTDEELKQFLETSEIPYKIQFANKHFAKLNNEFTKYILNGSGIKALFSTLVNDNDNNLKFFNKKVIQQYENNKLNSNDLLGYMNNPTSEQLLLYILDNSKKNFQPFLSSFLNHQKWFIIYFEIIKISIEKNLFSRIFPEINSCCTLTAIPKLSSNLITKSLFGSVDNNLTNSNVELLNAYETFLNNIKKSLIENTHNNLYYYPEDVEYKLNIEPILNQNNQFRMLKDEIDEDCFSVYKFESNNN